MSHQNKEDISIQKLKGGVSLDKRGQMRYVNGFDMSLVKRFYIIKNADTELIRGWRAHKIEQRCVYVLSGSFEFNTVKIDDWKEPSVDLPIHKIYLSAEELQVLHVPVGYGTAFKALEENSEMLVFADYGMEHAPLDDYKWSM